MGESRLSSQIIQLFLASCFFFFPFPIIQMSPTWQNKGSYIANTRPGSGTNSRRCYSASVLIDTTACAA